MKLVMKTLGLVVLLGLAVWAIRTDSSGASDAAAAPAAAGAVGGFPAGDAGWRHDPVWDDGKAEYCAYEVDWARYEAVYPGRALLIVVKEPWAPELDVKADRPRADGFEVLKLNHVRDVPTGIYTYHQMASVFVRRDGGELEKIAATSSEACGVSTAGMTGGRLETRSYFDGQGHRTDGYPGGALPEDGLPMMLRDYLDGAAPAELTVFPSLMMGRFAELAPAVYRLERRPVQSVEVPAGGGPGIELLLKNRDGWLSYTFDEAPPHRLLAHRRSDGTEYRLARCERLAYWTMHDPGGEQWLPERVR
jgi:hypothetical protein